MLELYVVADKLYYIDTKMILHQHYIDGGLMVYRYPINRLPIFHENLVHRCYIGILLMVYWYLIGAIDALLIFDPFSFENFKSTDPLIFFW